MIARAKQFQLSLGALRTIPSASVCPWKRRLENDTYCSSGTRMALIWMKMARARCFQRQMRI